MRKRLDDGGASGENAEGPEAGSLRTLGPGWAILGSNQ